MEGGRVSYKLERHKSTGEGRVMNERRRERNWDLLAESSLKNFSFCWCSRQGVKAKRKWGVVPRPLERLTVVLA